MKFTFPILASLFLASAHASDFYDEEDRVLHLFGGGGGGGEGAGIRGGAFPPGPPPEPTVSLDCSGLVVPCTPRRPRNDATEDSGVRVCVQHPRDENKSMTICLEESDIEGTVMVFSKADQCGCCGGECPTSCADDESSCECTGTGKDNEEYNGYTMTMTRRGWFGNEATVTTCVPADATVDAKLRGATCVTTCNN